MIIRLHSTLRGESGVRQVMVDAVDGAGVGEVLTAAAAAYPNLHPVLMDVAGRPRQDIVVFCNGHNVRLQRGLDTPLASDAQLSLFPSTGAQRAFATD